MTTATATVAAADGQRRRLRPDPEHRTVERRRIDGTVIDTISLDPHIFGVEPNAAVLYQVITAQLAGARAGTQSTRTRAEVAGGGAKPFRQKGTGRARQGSIRSPQWSGGGVALGPKPRSYRQRTPKKMIRLALYSALSDRASEGKVVVVDEWSFPAPKTKDAVAALAALELRGRVLVVLGPDDGIPDRSFANLADVQTIQYTELNAYDILKSDWVVFTDATLPGETTPVAAKAAPVRKARRAPTTEAAAAGKTAAGDTDTAGVDSEAADVVGEADAGTEADGEGSDA